MSFSSAYRARMKAAGANAAESFKNSTEAIINSTFDDSTSYAVIKVDGVETDARIVGGRDFKNKEMLLRPESTIPLGALVEYDQQKWLVLDMDGTATYPKASIVLCNEVIKWVGDNFAIYEYPCQVSASRYIKYTLASNSYDVDMPLGGMFVYVRNNADTLQVKLGQRFVFGNFVYEISGIDDFTYEHNGAGVIQFTTKLTTVKPNDDFINKLADNSTPKDIQNGGGSLW